MSSGSTDVARYGPAGFAAAVVDLAVLAFLVLTAFALLYYPALFVIAPVIAVNAVVAFVMSKGAGVAAQVGRGMLSACAAATVAALLIGIAVLIGVAATSVLG